MGLRLRAALWSSVAAHIVGVVGSLAAVPLFLRAFGTNGFGFWSSLLGLTSYLGLLNFGIAQTVASRASTHGDRPDLVWAAIRRGFSQYAKILLIAIPAVSIAAILTPWARLFKLELGDVQASRYAAIALGVTFLAELPFSIFKAGLQGIGAVAHERIVVIAATVVRVGVAGALAYLTPPLWFGILTLSLLNVASSIACFIVLRKLLPGSIFDKPPALQAGDDFNSSGAHYLALQIAGAATWGSDVILVGLVRGAAEAAQVAVALRIATFGMMIGTLVAPALGPFLAQAWARGETQKAQRLALESSQVLTGIGIIAALGFGAAGMPFMRLWVGAEFSIGYPAWLGFCAIMLVQGLLIVPHTFLTQAGLHRNYARWAVAEAVLKLTLSVVLVMKWGIVGLPLGTLLARLGTSFWVMTLDFTRALDEPPWLWIVRSCSSSLLPAAVFGIIYVLVSCTPAGGSDLGRLVAASLGGVGFATAFLWKGVAVETRRRLLGGLSWR